MYPAGVYFVRVGGKMYEILYGGCFCFIKNIFYIRTNSPNIIFNLFYLQ